MDWKENSKDGKERDENGKEMEGGGYYLDKAGKLCSMEKSDDGVTEDDLQKSLDQLETLTKSGDPTSRKESLLVKAQRNTLSADERDELFQILGGGPESGNETSAITKSMTSNEGLQKAVDVSDYLREQHTELVKSLDAVGDEIQKSDRRRQEFDLVLAKAIHDIGSMVKSLSEKVGVAVTQPARAPKSAGVRGNARPLQKSFAGGTAGNEETLSKGEILDTMEALHRDRLEKGGSTKVGGEDLMMAISRYESTHQISPAVYNAVKQYRQETASA